MRRGFRVAALLRLPLTVIAPIAARVAGGGADGKEVEVGVNQRHKGVAAVGQAGRRVLGRQLPAAAVDVDRVVVGAVEVGIVPSAKQGALIAA